MLVRARRELPGKFFKIAARPAKTHGTVLASSESIRVITDVYRRFWPPTPAYIVQAEILRHASQLDLLQRRVPIGGSVVDVGCGWGAFAAGCAALGYRVTMVDDRRDEWFEDTTDRRHAIPLEFGITVVEIDAVREPWPFADSSLDAVTSFDSMEHWHQSPKNMFQSALKSLKRRGSLIIGVPNAANLKKRLEALLGLTEWSAMEDWYEKPQFRGHVREPVVRDLKYIARSLGLVDVEIRGFNWMGRGNPSALVATITPFVDALLRLRPTLCSDIYLLARKE